VQQRHSSHIRDVAGSNLDPNFYVFISKINEDRLKYDTQNGEVKICTICVLQYEVKFLASFLFYG